MEKKGGDEALHRMRHSCAHVMAQAIRDRFPEAKFAIGPTIDDGFYYDVDLARPLVPEDLEAIEARMREIVAGDHAFVRREVPRDEARKIFSGNPYKIELIDDLPPEVPISLYTHADFVDLCRGPHVEHVKEIKAFKLLRIAGAYWRGDERRPMLQRIYGTAWPSEKELRTYIHLQEEAKKRDHRVLGRQLDLFSIRDEVGPGLVLWHQKGAVVRRVIEDLARDEHVAAGYDWVYSPHVGREELWQCSGHLGFYRANMFSEIDVEGQKYFVKPMNCPFHILIYRSKTRSYRDLPIRLAELGTVYRYERSGVMHGLMRVRGFTQDDAHIFCRPEQLEAEVVGVVAFVLKILRTFGFEEYEVAIATRPKDAVGDPALWERAEAELRHAADAAGLAYDTDAAGGAFYGPKIDIKVRDALGRPWQTATIQFDFNLPERFGLEYVGEDGKMHRPYMVHRALFGSLERFFGCLIEHYAGAFPLWLAPVQARVLAISEKTADWAAEAGRILRAAGLRVEVDAGAEKIGKKIRDAQTEKIPYMLVVGPAEVEGRAVAVRHRTRGDLGARPLDDFIRDALEEARERRP